MAKIGFNTVQELIEGGYSLHAYCHRPSCQHNQKLDLVQLRERLGPDHSTMHDELVPKLRCSKCRGKEIGLIRSPPPSTVNPYANHSSRIRR